MRIWQTTLTLPAGARGMRLITADVISALPQIQQVTAGTLHVFLRHTSASLAINENADPDVRADLEDALERLAPENAGYRHADEGSDDMPAHIKTALLGSSLTIPVTKGTLALGTWQGIYLWEHRRENHRRTLVLTLTGA